MDFETHYTDEQEQFRQEVCAWLDANVREELGSSRNPNHPDASIWRTRLAFQRELGQKGWLIPVEPPELDGSGLKESHEVILREELYKRGLYWLLDTTLSSIRKAIDKWGTSEQKENYLPQITNGEFSVWKILFEPETEPDIDGFGIQAHRDGDDYILNGDDVFLGQSPFPDYLWTIAVTDPDAIIHQSIGVFFVAADLDGITANPSNSLDPKGRHHVFFDNVVVPPHCLIGEENEGLLVTLSSIQEGSSFQLPTTSENEDVLSLIRYAQETTQNDTPLSDNPLLQQLLVEVYLDNLVSRVLRTRNAWMTQTGKKLTYHYAEIALLDKRAALRFSRAARDIMGMFALLDTFDTKAPMNGKLEEQQRSSLADQNLTAGPDSQLSIIAKHLGLNRKKDNSDPIT